MGEYDNLTVKELLRRMKESYDDFNAYLNSLTEKQLTGPTDAAGWTAKDHIIHLAVWEDGVTAALEGQIRHERMGLDLETFKIPGFDQTNEVIRQQHKNDSLADVLAKFHEVHGRMTQLVENLSDVDLQRPYSSFAPTSTSDRPIIDYIVGDTYDHFDTHKPWIAAIVK